MAEKVFVRVKDKRTGHEFDVHAQALDSDIHEELKRFPRVSVARPAKTRVEQKKTSTVKVVEGVSPAGDELATPTK